MSKENELFTREYVPHGPIRVQPPTVINPIKPGSKPLLGTKISDRKPGWIYDIHTWIELGPASDEMKAAYPARTVICRAIAGLKQSVMIW